MRLLLVASMALVLAGCDKPATRQERPNQLATIGNRSIGTNEWNAEVARRVAGGQTLPDKEKLLEEMILREALIVRALEVGIDKLPETRRRYENLLIAELKERELKPKLEKVTVSPEEIQTVLKQPEVHQPAQMRLAVLQQTVHARATENKRRQISERLREARKKADQVPVNEIGFGPLAVDYSDDQSTRYTGGDKGWFDIGNTNYSLAPELITAANGLSKIGEVSDVIETAQGFYMVRLMDRRAAGTKSLSRHEPSLQHKAVTQERKRIEAEFYPGVRSQASVEVNTQSVTALPYRSVPPLVDQAPPSLP